MCIPVDIRCCASIFIITWYRANCVSRNLMDPLPSYGLLYPSLHIAHVMFLLFCWGCTRIVRASSVVSKTWRSGSPNFDLVVDTVTVPTAFGGTVIIVSEIHDRGCVDFYVL